MDDNLTTERISDEFSCIVSEMASPGEVVPISSDMLERINQIDPDTHDAKFVVVQIESGISKSKRTWRPEIIEKVAEQVKAKLPNGYTGHIPERDDEYAFPEPHTRWLGAVVKKTTSGTMALVKGYNLKGSKVRDWLLTQAIDSVSIRGNATMKAVRGGVEIVDFDLESIDWSRRNRAGMRAPVVAIASEMEGGGNVDGKDIAALTESDLRTHNTSLVELIERKATETQDKKIGEMETTAVAAKADTDIVSALREKLGLETKDNPLEAIADLLESVEAAAKDKVNAFVSDLLDKKIPNEKARALVARMVGEMEGDVTKAEDRTAIETKVNELLDSDEVTAVVSEMGGFTSEDGGTKDAPGGQHLRAAPPTNEVEETDTIRRRKITVGAGR